MTRNDYQAGGFLEGVRTVKNISHIPPVKPSSWTDQEWERAQDEECKCDIPGPHKVCRGEK